MLFTSAVLYFSVALWCSISSLSGWATNNELPNKFVLHWTLISEPSKINPKEKGVIYFWATELNEDHQPKKEEINSYVQPFIAKHNDTEPRVYRLPYSEKTHQELIKAMQRIREGKTVVGSSKKLSGDGDEKQGKQGKGKGKGKEKGKQGDLEGEGKGSLSQKQEFMFYDLPPFKLQEKNPQN